MGFDQTFCNELLLIYSSSSSSECMGTGCTQSHCYWTSEKTNLSAYRTRVTNQRLPPSQRNNSLSLSPYPYKPTNHHKFPQSRERREQCLFALATRRGQDFSQIQKAELILLSSSLPDFPFKILFSSPIYLPPPLVLLDILDSRLIDCVEWVSRNHCLGRYWREMAPKSGKGKSGKTSNRAEKKKKEEKGMSAPC